MRPNLRVKRRLVVEPIGLRAEEIPRPIDTRRLFGNDHPLELEIGTGKGTFLTEQAKTRPHINFLGLERARKYWQYAADRLRRNGCYNTRLILMDAASLDSGYLEDASVSAIHIYFPDPWPKKRHHKRRLLQAPFLLELERVLRLRGRLQIVTDHLEYFEQIERLVRASPLMLTAYRSPGASEGEEIAGTNFERKYRREGRPIYTVAAIKS